MTMPATLARCLNRKQARFDTVRHPSPAEPSAALHKSTVPADRVARAVLLEDDRGYLVAVIPATHRLKLAELREQSGRDLKYAHADGVREVFRDCDVHALPAVGMAYGTLTWIDDSLLSHDDVYFEAGDREALVHMSAEAFSTLMAEARRGHFAHRMM